MVILAADMDANAAKELRAAIKNAKPETVQRRMRIKVDRLVQNLPDFGNFVDFYNARTESSVKAEWENVGREDGVKIVWHLDGRPSGDVAWLLTIDRLVDLVADWKAVRNGQKDSRAANTLVDYCRRMTRATTTTESPLGATPTTVFVLVGLTKGLKSRKVRGVSYDDAETCLSNAAMLGIRIWRGVEGPVELADFLHQASKTLSSMPQISMNKQAGFEWHSDRFKGSVAISEAGVGLKNLWVKQLQMIRGTSPEIANAVADVYPSLRQLLQAYDRCASKEEGEGLLANLNFVRGPEGLSTSRRVGPAASKKIFTAFNGDAKDLV